MIWRLVMRARVMLQKSMPRRCQTPALLLALLSVLLLAVLPALQRVSYAEYAATLTSKALSKPRQDLGPQVAEVWRQRHDFDLAALAGARAGRCGVVLLGDAAAEGWARPPFRGAQPEPATCSSCGIAGAGLQTLAAGSEIGKTVLTFAISGDRVSDLLWRLSVGGGADALARCRPGTVVLLPGGSDLGQASSMDAVAQDLRDVFGVLRKMLDPSTVLLLHALLPRGKGVLDTGPVIWDATNPAYQKTTWFNKLLEEHATSGNQEGGNPTYLVDCSDELLEHRDASSYLSRRIFPDMLELSAEGYQLWGACLFAHLRVHRPATPVSLPGAAGAVALVPRVVRLPFFGYDGQGEAVEVLWQRPSAAVRAVALLLHGCQHQATDFWPRLACEDCAGLPEEVRIVRAALARGYVPMAVTSANRLSKCWAPQDEPRVEAAVAHVYAQEGIQEGVPLYAFGASSGGGFVGILTGTATVGRIRMKCRIPQIMVIESDVKFSAPSEGGREVSWPAPPTLFIHMPKDAMMAEAIETSLQALWEGGVVAAQLRCEPLVISAGFFASRVENVTAPQSKALADALRTGSFLAADGRLATDPRRTPRGGRTWREALLATGVPQALGDGLKPDGSHLSEVMNVAWAQHEICATYAQEMFDFCEDPAGTCTRKGWQCRAP